MLHIPTAEEILTERAMQPKRSNHFLCRTETEIRAIVATASEREAWQHLILEFVIFDISLGCWLYTGTTSNGYASGRFSHRISHTLWRGMIPPNLVLDHEVCNVKRCLNPWHTEPVTNEENIRRGSALRRGQ